MELNYSIIGRQIKVFRKKRHISQERLAEEVNISPSSVSYIENAKKGLKLETLVNIANALLVSADQLLGSNIQNRHEIKDEFSEILADCNEYEKRIIIDIARSLKISLRDDRKQGTYFR